MNAAPTSRATGAHARRRIGGWVVLALVVGVLVGIPMTITLVNDAAARSVETTLLDLPLPEGAERIDSMAQAGKLIGNGNGMQYLGALLIRSDQTTDALQAFYDAQVETDGLSIMVAPSGSPGTLDGAVGFLLQGAEPGTFDVWAWGEGPGSLFEEFDLRGH